MNEPTYDYFACVEVKTDVQCKTFVEAEIIACLKAAGYDATIDPEEGEYEVIDRVWQGHITLGQKPHEKICDEGYLELEDDMVSISIELP